MGAAWTIRKNARARKGEESLPAKFRTILVSIIGTLERTGKAVSFPNYGPLKQCGKNVYHCHMNSGKPTYVMIWTVDPSERTISITYIGTHEKAPY